MTATETIANLLPTTAPGMRPSTVATHLGVSTAKATAMLRAAEKAGVACRCAHPLLVRQTATGANVYRDGVGFVAVAS